MPSRRAARVAAMALASVLVAPACGQAGSSRMTPASPIETPGREQATVVTGPVDGAEMPSGTGETTTRDTCLQGSWFLSTPALQSYFDVVASETRGPVFTVEGAAILEFHADGTSAYRFSDYALTTDMAGVPIRIDLEGQIKGRYETDGTRITSRRSPQDDLQVTVSASGTRTDASAYADVFLDALPLTDAPYSCDGSALTIDFPTAASRVPLTLPRHDGTPVAPEGDGR